jgi:hypothetical protein
MSETVLYRPSARSRSAAEVARALIQGDWQTLDELQGRIAEALERGLPRLPRIPGGKVKHTRSRALPPIAAAH